MNEPRRRGPIARVAIGLWDTVNCTRRLVFNLLFLALLVIVVFFSFVLLVAFAPQVIAIRLFEGSHLTVGIALGFAQFVFFCALTWVYVRRANGEFDVLNAQIVQDALRKTA